MNKEVDFEFIKYRRQALKVNLKKECEKYETLKYNYNNLIEKIKFYSDILRKRGFAK